jgi:hypothetical protein
VRRRLQGPGQVRAAPLDRRLANLETFAATSRMMGDPDRQLGRIQAEIDGATTRLRALLAE